jgi:hypothetical protein
MAWKYGLAFAAFVVIAVNAAFIYVAVSGADPVEASYIEAKR